MQRLRDVRQDRCLHSSGVNGEHGVDHGAPAIGRRFARMPAWAVGAGSHYLSARSAGG